MPSCPSLCLPRRLSAGHYRFVHGRSSSSHTPHRAVFSPLSVPGARLLTATAMYVGLNLVGLGVVLWKVRAMGLLPLTSADWVSLLPQRLPLQLAAAGAPA